MKHAALRYIKSVSGQLPPRKIATQIIAPLTIVPGLLSPEQWLPRTIALQAITPEDNFPRAILPPPDNYPLDDRPWLIVPGQLLQR